MSEVIERVLVALDAGADSRVAIAAAVRFAVRAHAPLHAVFVEDEELLSLAGLSIARQIIPGAAAAPLRREEVELHWRAAAARARQEVLAAAQTNALRCSFEIVRGAAAALAVASERDLVVAGAFARPVAGHFRIASQWLAAFELAPGPMVLIHENRENSGAIVVLVRESSPQAARLLRAASRIARLGSAPLMVITAAALATASDFAAWVNQQIEPGAAEPRIEAAPEEPAALRQRLAELDCGLLAIGAGSAESGPARLLELAQRPACDVLVVR